MAIWVEIDPYSGTNELVRDFIARSAFLVTYEMIDSLFKKVSDNGNDGIMRELLLDLYTSSGKRKPDQIIMFRDGVSESQFDQVLNVELNQIIEACKFLDEKWCPKSVVIIAQKKPASPDNVAPGTVIDNRICHPPMMISTCVLRLE